MTAVLVTGAGGSAAENFVDALRLGDAEHWILGIDCSPSHLHLSTADERVLGLRSDDDGFIPAVQALCKRYDVAVVHAQPDSDVNALSAGRDLIDAATYLPPAEALALAADKEATAQVLHAAEVRSPESVRFADEADAHDRVADLLERHATVWVRALRGAGTRGALPVTSPEQALAWISWWTEERGLTVTEFMAAQMLPGREFAYQSLWQDGELVAGQARERLEYLYGHLTPSGQTSTPAVARTVANPVVDTLAMAAIRAIDPHPHGVFCVDMKEDAEGRPCVTELNVGRFFTTSNFFAHAGLNMPDLMVRCALGERPARLETSPLEPDLYWVRMVDMGYALVRGEDLDAWPRANP